MVVFHYAEYMKIGVIFQKEGTQILLCFFIYPASPESGPKKNLVRRLGVRSQHSTTSVLWIIFSVCSDASSFRNLALKLPSRLAYGNPFIP